MKGSVTNTKKNRGEGWDSSGLLNNPAVNTVMADTGPLPAGIYDFYIIVYQRVSAANQGVDLQHRDAANLANLVTQWIMNQMEPPGAPWHGTVNFHWEGYAMALDERIRVIQGQNAVGEVQVSIQWVRRR